MSSRETVELLINAKWLIPVVPENQVYEDCALAVDDGVIVALVPQAEAAKRFEARETLDLSQHIVLPGLINAHGHAAMSLFRGYADDLPLQEWLEDHIWPAEGRWVSESFVHDGTQLAMAEMIRSGTTCFSDMYFYPDEVAAAAQTAGMRAQVCAPVLDFPTVWAQDADEYIHKAVAVHDDFRTSELITIGFGPHAPYTVSDAPLQRIATLADELQAPVQIHLHEAAHEVEQALQNDGRRPTERLAELNFLSPLTQCIHMTQVEPVDIEILQRTGAPVVHCPESNLKLANGFCPLNELLAAGINVALGTDGCASNNDLDMFGEMRTAALLAKPLSQNAATLDAHQTLRLATINAARAMGQEERIGSLEAGKAADITAVAVDQLEALPLYNPASHLVYSNVGHDVTHVWVDGKPLLRDRVLTTLNEGEIKQRTRDWQQQISEAKQ